MHTYQIARGDGANKQPCWITVTEEIDPFKPYELGFSNTVRMKELQPSKIKMLCTINDSYECIKKCSEEHKNLK